MSERLLLPDVRCPRCGCAPPLRIPESERELARTQAPDAVKLTHRCTNRVGGRPCGHVYPVPARAYQTAA